MNEPWSKDTTPLFSLLIANYNNGQYLQECLDSVFAQTYKNWEIILVDDASTDGISKKIYEKYKNHQQIKIFFNQENKGCGYTKRRCAKEASGEICGFLDPDDTITPNALSIMVKAHTDNPKICAAHSDHYRCDENMNITGKSETPFNAHELLIGMTAFTSFKRSFYSRTIGINPCLKRAVDHDLYLKLKETGSTFFVNDVLYYYRHHSNSISLNENQMKALFWDNKVKRAAYNRRKGTAFINFKKSDLNKEEFAYYIKKAVSKSVTKEYKKMYYCLWRASRFIYLDKKLSIFRIALAPIKI